MEHEIGSEIRRTNRQSPGAFTLIELLVVIAIVIVLAALAFPVITSVRENGNQAKCASNMRQIFAAFNLYVQDHGNTLPQRMYTGSSTPSIGYSELLLPYISPGESPTNCPLGKKIFVCPSQTSADYPDEPGYGMNWFYDNANLLTVARPAQVILLAETIGTGGTGSRRADRDNTSSDIGKLDDKRHRGKANYVFFDGHIERLAYADTRVLRTQNADPVDDWGTNDNDHSVPLPSPLPF